MTATVTTALTPPQKQLCSDYVGLVELALRQQSSKYPSTDRAELRSAGQLGLIKAALDYRPALGELQRFAAAHVRGAMLDAVRKTFRTWTREAVPARAFAVHAEDPTPEEEHQKLMSFLAMDDAAVRNDAVRDLRLRATGLAVARLNQAASMMMEDEELHQREVALAYAKLQETVRMVTEPQATFWKLYYDEALTLDEGSVRVKTSKGRVERIGKRLIVELQAIFLGDRAA